MKKTFVKQTEINSGGGVRLSIYKQIFDDAGGLVFEEPHRITIGPLDDFDAIIGYNNNGLAELGYPPIDLGELDLPRSLRTTAHKHPMVKAAVDAERNRSDDERAAFEAARITREAEEKQAAADRELQSRADEEAGERRFQEAVAAEVAKLFISGDQKS